MSQLKNILDNKERIKKLDKSNVLGSAQQLWQQLQQTMNELKNVKVPSNYHDINKIVINGMGGSRLGARVAQRLFEDRLKVPIYPIGAYSLPRFVDEKTLVILSSYSGNTEEIISSAKEVFNKTKKVLVLSQDGQLTRLAKKKRLPGYYSFVPKHNPCNQPRMSIGYQVLGIILLLEKCGLLTVSEAKIKALIKTVKKAKDKYDVNKKTAVNPAKKISRSLKNKIPILIASEHLMGALHVVRNQINENAKQLAFYFEIPELNHHLLEGLKFPYLNEKSLFFILIQSNLYYKRNQLRINISKKVLNGYKIDFQEIKLSASSKLEQAFELIQLGCFVSFYLAMINNLNPTPIPWVDYFKKELKNLPS